MLALRTHFEQVPLETVRKIAEEEAQREKAAEQGQATKKGKIVTEHWKPQSVSGGGNHDSSIRYFPGRERWRRAVDWGSDNS